MRRRGGQWCAACGRSTRRSKKMKSRAASVRSTWRSATSKSMSWPSSAARPPKRPPTTGTTTTTPSPGTTTNPPTTMLRRKRRHATHASYQLLPRNPESLPRGSATRPWSATTRKRGRCRWMSRNPIQTRMTTPTCTRRRRRPGAVPWHPRGGKDDARNRQTPTPFRSRPIARTGGARRRRPGGRRANAGWSFRNRAASRPRNNAGRRRTICPASAGAQGNCRLRVRAAG